MRQEEVRVFVRDDKGHFTGNSRTVYLDDTVELVGDRITAIEQDCDCISNRAILAFVLGGFALIVVGFILTWYT